MVSRSHTKHAQIDGTITFPIAVHRGGWVTAAVNKSGLYIVDGSFHVKSANEKPILELDVMDLIDFWYICDSYPGSIAITDIYLMTFKIMVVHECWLFCNFENATSQ